MKHPLTMLRLRLIQPMEVDTLYDLQLPGGKRLGDATMEDLEEAAKWHEQVGAEHRLGREPS